MYESSVDGMPRKPKPREWFLYLDQTGEIVHGHLVSQHPYQPKDGDELVQVIEVIHD